MSIVTPTQVANELGTTFDGPTTAKTQQQIDMVQAELENYLNRWLERKSGRTANAQAMRDGGINLRGVMVSVDSVVVEGGDATEIDWRWDYTNRDRIIVSGGASYATLPSTYEVTYTAGDMNVDDAAKALVLNTVVANAVVGTKVAVGAIAGMSVEGTSINYGDRYTTGARANGGWGPWTAVELASVNRLRRRVFR